MDLTVETKQYKFCYQTITMSWINVFICSKFKRCIGSGETVWLTKKDMKELIAYLSAVDFGLKHIKETCLEQLSSMEMLMEGKDKASFYFW